MDKIIFLKAADRRDTNTPDMFHLETRTRKDGVTQKYRVTAKELPPNRFKGADPVKTTPDLFTGPVDVQPAPAGPVPKKLDLPTIAHDGDVWHILSTGTRREDGKVFAHLSSTTRGRQQKNGVNPIQMQDWVEMPEPADAAPAPGVPSEQMKSSVLSQWGKVADQVEGYHYLAGKVRKTERGIFVVDGTFGRDTFKAVMAEAKRASLDTKKLHIVCEKATYTGASIDVMRLDDFAPGSIQRGAPLAKSILFLRP